jgi:hypothetical protein
VGVPHGVPFEHCRAFASVRGRLPNPCGAGAKGFARQGCATGVGQCRGGPVPGRARAGAGPCRSSQRRRRITYNGDGGSGGVDAENGRRVRAQELRIAAAGLLVAYGVEWQVGFASLAASATSYTRTRTQIHPPTTHTQTRTHRHAHIHTHTHIHKHTSERARAHTHTHTNTYTHARTHTHTHTRTHTHARTHTRTHTRTHARARIKPRGSTPRQQRHTRPLQRRRGIERRCLPRNAPTACADGMRRRHAPRLLRVSRPIRSA